MTQDQADNRLKWIDIKLAKRGHSEDWKDVVYYDELHYRIGHKETIKVKRPTGKEYRLAKMNVQLKEKTSKDIKAKAREEGHEMLLSVFIVIGYNYRKMVIYQVPSNVGKMTSKVYINDILPRIAPELIAKGLTLCQDADSAYNSRATLAWAKKQGLSLLTLPGKSPDFSILESMANPIKHLFFSRRTRSEKARLARFTRVFNEEVSQDMINGLYKGYTARFHEISPKSPKANRSANI